MNKATLSGLHRRASLRKTKAANRYQDRPIKYWQQELRKYEIVLEVIKEYEKDCKEEL